MNKPSMIKGSKGHKKALQELKVNRAGYENLPDGRSKSSTFQQRELTEEEMQAQLDAADKMQVDVGAEKYKSTDLGDANFNATMSMLDFKNEDGTFNTERFFSNLKRMEPYLLRTKEGSDQLNKLYDEFGYKYADGSHYRSDGRINYNKVQLDPNKVARYATRYNNYIKIKPYMEEGYSFQDHQQKLDEAEQEREAGEYNKKLAVDLVRRGDYDTIEDAMNALNKG